jgi:four helix bundle protein
MRYEKLEAFQACDNLTHSIYDITENWPSHEKYGLRSQIRRASFSAAVNIVEGSSRLGSAEFARFLGISVSSLNEVEYCLRFAKRRGYLDDCGHDDAKRKLRNAGALTWKLYVSIAKAKRKPPRRRDD